MQFIHIAGNVGKDAVTKDVNGTSVTEWSVGVSAGRNSETTWFKCSLWGGRGEKLAGYITKGNKITVAGTLQAGVYDGKPDLKVNVQEVALQGGRGDDAAPRQSASQMARMPSRGFGAPRPVQPGAFDDDLSDDVPF